MFGDIEWQFGVRFSSRFRDFWNAHVPDKTEPFEVEIAGLPRGTRAELARHPKGWEHGWIVRVRDDVSSDVGLLEVALAHEVLHLVLQKEGYPAVCLLSEDLEGTLWEELAKTVSGILEHPIIDLRLSKNWCLPVDEYWSAAMDEDLDIINSFADPDPDDAWNWLQWVLTYVIHSPYQDDLACHVIRNRHSSVAEVGERIAEWLRQQGYSEPHRLTPPVVEAIGAELLEALGAVAHLKMCVLEKPSSNESGLGKP